MSNAFGIEHVSISKFDGGALAGVDDVVGVSARAKKPKQPSATSQIKAAVPPSAANKIRGNLQAIGTGSSVAKREDRPEPTVTAPLHKQRRREARLRRMRTEAVAKGMGGPMLASMSVEDVSKALGDTTGVRGSVNEGYVPPGKHTAGPDVGKIRGKLAPLKQAVIASAKAK